MNKINPLRHSNNKNSFIGSKDVEKQNFMANYLNLPFIIAKPSERKRTQSLMTNSLLKSERSTETQTTILQRFQDQEFRHKVKQEKINLKQEEIRLPTQQQVLKQALPIEGNNQRKIIKGLKNYDYHIQEFRSKIPPEPCQYQLHCSSDNQEINNYSPPPKNKFTKNIFVKNHRAKTISFEDMNQNQESYSNYQQKQKNRTKKDLRRKLKISFIFVRAAMRFSKQYRKLYRLCEKHNLFVSKFRQMDLRVHHKNFVGTISNKIFLYIKTQQYSVECQQVWYEDENQVTQDIRRTRYCGFSLMFLQNLELLTRPENLPILITHQLNLSLFNQNNNTASQFVLNRCNFYQKKVTELTTNEKVLIAVEFFLFEVVIPSLIDLGNGIENSDLALINQTQHYLIGIMSILQQLFTCYFSNMTLIKKQKQIKRQKTLNVKPEKLSGLWKLQIETNAQQEKDETQIIAGCFPKEVLEEISSQKKHWSQKLYKLFQQIVSNLHKQIKV